MVVHILGKLLHMVGILPTDKVTEVQRTDLVGKFVGHTGPKTRSRIQEAEGGILFVDEAYGLIPMQKSDDCMGFKILFCPNSTSFDTSLIVWAAYFFAYAISCVSVVSHDSASKEC
ncbi:hypothetical protein RIF29_39872 [Crotalaria pallida]